VKETKSEGDRGVRSGSREWREQTLQENKHFVTVKFAVCDGWNCHNCTFVTVVKPLMIYVLQENFAAVLKTVVTTVAIDVETD
jgi:hypothetical protein